MAPLAVDESENLGKKSKPEWSCTLCGITVTSEKQLNAHHQGKKHKAKETFLRTQKIGKSTKISLSLKKKKKRVKSNEVVSINSGFDSRPNH